MSKGTQLWPGERMRAFYRAHIARATTLDDAASERLVDALVAATNRMLVWQMPDTAVDGRDAAAVANADAKSTSDETTSKPDPAFNPYAFSALALLARHGADALRTRLADIDSVENLKSFADAQHLAIDQKLTSVEALRKAVLKATEQRLADRKAAAS